MAAGERALEGRLEGAEVADVVETLIQTYLGLRERDDERFVDVVARVGIDPFKERVYAEAD